MSWSDWAFLWGCVAQCAVVVECAFGKSGFGTGNCGIGGERGELGSVGVPGVVKECLFGGEASLNSERMRVLGCACVALGCTYCEALGGGRVSIPWCGRWSWVARLGRGSVCTERRVGALIFQQELEHGRI